MEALGEGLILYLVTGFVWGLFKHRAFLKEYGSHENFVQEFTKENPQWDGSPLLNTIATPASFLALITVTGFFGPLYVLYNKIKE